jgi:hypothetical protein
MEDEVHEGGCLCGAVRYAVRGKPVRTSVCHCRYCQRRSGSAFGVLPFFKAEAVSIVKGTPATYRHVSDESGRWLQSEFCAACGTTTGLTVELRQGMRGVAGGTFDDPGWFTVERHIWTRSRLPWVPLPEGGCEILERG